MGSVTTALVAAGHQCLASVECDATARSVFAALHPKVPTWHDALDLDEAFYAATRAADVVVSCPPCTAYSVAGSMVGSASAAGRLLLLQLGVVDRCRNPVYIFENVPGLRLARNGLDYDTSIAGLEARGYIVQSNDVNSRDCGSIQSRTRIIIVATRADIHSRTGNFPYPAANTQSDPGRTVRSILQRTASHDPSLRPDATYRSCINKTHLPGYDGPKVFGYTGDGGIGQRLYDIDGAACTIKSKPQSNPGSQTQVYYDTTCVPPVCRRLSVAEAAAVAGHDLPECLARLPPDDAYRLLGNTTDGHVNRYLASNVGPWLRPLLASTAKPARGSPVDTRTEFCAIARATGHTDVADAVAAACSDTSNDRKWKDAVMHTRCCHADDDTLQASGYKCSKDFCEVCAMGKPKRKP